MTGMGRKKPPSARNNAAVVDLVPNFRVGTLIAPAWDVEAVIVGSFFSLLSISGGLFLKNALLAWREGERHKKRPAPGPLVHLLLSRVVYRLCCGSFYLIYVPRAKASLTVRAKGFVV